MKLGRQSFKFIHLRRFRNHLVIGGVLLGLGKIIEKALLTWHPTPCNLAHVSLPSTAREQSLGRANTNDNIRKRFGRQNPAALTQALAWQREMQKQSSQQRVQRTTSPLGCNKQTFSQSVCFPKSYTTDQLRLNKREKEIKRRKKLKVSLDPTPLLRSV